MDEFKIIEDVGVEWHPELDLILLTAEMLDGSVEEMVGIQPRERPPFDDDGEPTVDEDALNAWYGDWYDEALAEAHRRGYRISGEVE